MNQRPEIHENRNSQELLQYYYLLAELKDFCRIKGISTAGSKEELTTRIGHYLDTGERLKAAPKVKQTMRMEKITPDSLIEENIKCSEVHRAYFKLELGKSFTFNVAFQNWLKANSGKTYRDAAEAYHRIKEEKKNGRKEISKQFEYNTYTRDFFEDNPGASRELAIACWKYKKGIPGHNKYERSDIDSLEC